MRVLTAFIQGDLVIMLSFKNIDDVRGVTAFIQGDIVIITLSFDYGRCARRKCIYSR